MYSIIGSILIVFGLYVVVWGKGKELEGDAEQKLTKGSNKGQPLEITITNYRADDNGSDMKSHITTLFSFLTSKDKLPKEGQDSQEQNEVKDGSGKGNEGKEIPLNNTDSKPST